MAELFGDGGERSLLLLEGHGEEIKTLCSSPEHRKSSGSDFRSQKYTGRTLPPPSCLPHPSLFHILSGQAGCPLMTELKKFPFLKSSYFLPGPSHLAIVAVHSPLGWPGTEGSFRIVARRKCHCFNVATPLSIPKAHSVAASLGDCTVHS